MVPYYTDDTVTLYHGDCREIAGYRVAAVAMHRDGLGALQAGEEVAWTMSTWPTLSEGVAELLHAVSPKRTREG